MLRKMFLNITILCMESLFSKLSVLNVEKKFSCCRSRGAVWKDFDRESLGTHRIQNYFSVYMFGVVIIVTKFSSSKFPQTLDKCTKSFLHTSTGGCLII